MITKEDFKNACRSIRAPAEDYTTILDYVDQLEAQLKESEQRGAEKFESRLRDALANLMLDKFPNITVDYTQPILKGQEITKLITQAQQKS